ncbi:methyltransferase family protein [Aquimarina algicola]|uniref:Isoprenylcysteine carboxylmethyltransferase family protein n=1 Tax=Aquimarina algicola TaxID=2589995 RepID=A0A504JCD0_9FLAO|nr:isoprenylcysteine carboxylmethyltransferase family protein [Aquimarina algicola]TPN83971.1 isoprenylcysteine carboxylmethyltransferase family protein [Aquimarina algicola]
MKGTAYLIQATLILFWWLGLSLSSTFFQAFQFPNIDKIAFNSFFAPDIIIITTLSIIRAYKPLRDLEFIILGGFAYGSFYCLNASILTGGGYLATTLMALGLFYNLFLVYQTKAFRESQSSNIIINGCKTFIQIICVWLIALVVFPYIIINEFDIPIHSNNISTIISITLFVIFSSIGLTSAFAIISKGDGTPLPIDQTKKLVVSGPYKYVRNPMAIAGIGQGIAIGIYFSSVHLIIYACIGAVMWHFVVRPIEEKNMVNRFGEEYENYRKTVYCWIPRLKTTRQQI